MGPVPPSGAAPGAGNSSGPFAPSGSCFGVWPPGGQDYYTNGCYGHDEPGIQFYSNLPGSGGNITWNVTLPTSRDPNDTQSDLYTAIWFGMTLSDPYAWMDQCFLELQFYPDSDWSSTGSVYGSWVGAAVAWQIEASTGYEDSCFYQVLNQPNGNELAMYQGDRINVTMTGWVGNPLGENLTITDETNGQVSYVTMYNSQQGYPINPAYPTNNYPNGLQWTPGGEYPVVFAFEIGHTVPPYPNNNSYGGCSSGPPPSTPANPSVPCPSYDPTSWINDTTDPWHISVPTFFNQARRESPVQVSFSQDLGGISFIDPLSNGVCDGRDGSAWCSYPWYSFSCSDRSFAYGATNYPDTTTDFGGYRQFATNFVLNAAQLGFYPPTNFSIPACGASGYSLNVSSATPGAGNAYFLSQPVGAATLFPGLLPGNYSLSALPGVGQRFLQWVTTGGAVVADPESPWASVEVLGNGSVVATFTNGTVPTSAMSFASATPAARMAIVPGLLFANDTPVTTLAAGAVLSLAPGLYSIQSYPPSGTNFTSWSVSGAGATVAAPELPFTWLVVQASGASFTLNASFVSSSTSAYVLYAVYGTGGSVSFDGSAPTTSSASAVAVGTYSLVSYPDAGMELSYWYVYTSGLIIDFGDSTNVTIEAGTTYLYAAFSPEVDFSVSPAGAGAISVNGATPLAAQSLYLVGSATVDAVPSSGYVLTGWTTSNSANVDISGSTSGDYYLYVSGSANVTATFGPAVVENLTFHASPSSAGAIVLNGIRYLDGDVATTLSNGTYPITAAAAPGYVLTGWSTSGPVSFTGGGLLNLTGSGGSVTADFTLGTFPVTFLIDPPNAGNITVGGPSGSVVANGDTLWLSGGATSLSASVSGGNASFLGWGVSPSLLVSGGSGATLSVGGPGAVTLFTTVFSLTAGILPSGSIQLGDSVRVYAQAAGTGTFSYLWSGLPPGCPPRNVSSILCTPTQVGSFHVVVTVNWTDGPSTTLSVGTITVVNPLVVHSFTVTPVEFTVGGSATFAVVAGGGTAPLRYTYSGLPPGCGVPTAPNFQCTPSAPGFYAMSVLVKDATGRSLENATDLTVNALPQVATFGVSPTHGEVGQYFNGSMTVHGGTAPFLYAFDGLPPGCSAGNVTSFVCVPTANGTFSVSANVTDADGYSANASVPILVLPRLTVVSFQTVGWSGYVDTLLNLSVHAVDGLPPYTYHYSGLPNGCHSGNTSLLQCTPGVVGNYSVVVNVTDLYHVLANATLLVHIATPPPPGPTPTTPAGGWTTLDTLLLAVAVAAVVALGIALALRRRNRPPPSAADAPAEVSPESSGTGPPADEEST